MVVTLKTNPGDKVLELGGGSCPQFRPNVDVRPCQDAAGNQTVDFTADFNGPLPIQSDEWDAVFCQYALEHVSWRSVPGFLKECLRILKPGGKAVFVVPDTEAQIGWMRDNPNGWDGKGFFESASCLLFGDQDYPENSHKCFLNPHVAKQLFTDAGFEGIVTHAYGARDTDMVIEARKPVVEETVDVRWEGDLGKEVMQSCDTIVSQMRRVLQPITREIVQKERESVIGAAMAPGAISFPPDIQPTQFRSKERGDGLGLLHKVNGLTEQERADLFDKVYFNGGQKVGGYKADQWGAYRDFPVHEVTARHVLARKPESVLELGCARGYVVKRLQDAGVRAAGLEISKHCHMTRVCDGIHLMDLCDQVWNIDTHPSEPSYDLCFSIACLEHVPEEYLPAVIRNMTVHCKRGLHGIDFGGKDDGWDKTHCTLKSKSFWVEMFAKHAPGWPVEIVDKEELERGEFPRDVLDGDGKVKLNVGSYSTMHHHGWLNVDVHDLGGYASQNGYRFLRHDVRQGVPCHTGTVDLIHCCHMLEHLTYDEGRSFLRECRRVLKPDTGAMRIVVPDAALLMGFYDMEQHRSAYEPDSPDLSQFDEISDGCASSPTAAGKLHALLWAGHQSIYDWDTMKALLEEVGFIPYQSSFRETAMSEPVRPGISQILRETADMFPCLSMYTDCVPKIG